MYVRKTKNFQQLCYLNLFKQLVEPKEPKNRQDKKKIEHFKQRYINSTWEISICYVISNSSVLKEEGNVLGNTF